MINSITVAWAIPVDTAFVGARIEAYAEAKATISMLRLCIKYAQTGTSLGNIPTEMVENVATHVRQSIFESRLKGWQNAMICCMGECSPRDHISPEEFCDLVPEYLSDMEDDSDMEGELMMELRCQGIGDDEHEEVVLETLSKIGENFVPRKGTDFSKYRKTFTEQFGLEVYFTVSCDYSDNNVLPMSPARKILAYLILPSVYSHVRTSQGPLEVSFLSAMIVDPSLTKEPSSEQHDLFKAAMRTLQLKPSVDPVQATSTYPTPDRASLTAKDNLVRHEEANVNTHWCSKRKVTQDHASAMALTEWPKLMVLASGKDYATEPDY